MSDCGFVNHYEIIGVPPEATPAQIHEAVKETRRTWVLRQNAPALERRQEAETMLARVAEAEKVLLQPGLRRGFDEELGARKRQRAEASGRHQEARTQLHHPPVEGNVPIPPYADPPRPEWNRDPRPPVPHPPSTDFYPPPHRDTVVVPPWNHPQGTTILVLGIARLFCAVTAPIAWYMGSRSRREIRLSGVHPLNEQQLVWGYWLGLVVTVLLLLWSVLAISMMAVGA